MPRSCTNLDRRIHVSNCVILKFFTIPCLRQSPQQKNMNHDIVNPRTFGLQRVIDSDNYIENTKCNIKKRVSFDSQQCCMMPDSKIQKMRRGHVNSVSSDSLRRMEKTSVLNSNKKEDDDKWIDVLFKNSDAMVEYDVAEVDFSSHRPSAISYSKTAFSDDDASILSDFSQPFLEEEKSWRRTDSAASLQPLLQPTSKELLHQPSQVDIPPSSSNSLCTSMKKHKNHDKANFSIPPSQQQQDELSELEFTTYTINSVKECDQPMLLTLTSYPFRVIYANQAYQRMLDQDERDSSLHPDIGKSFYEIFDFNKDKETNLRGCHGLLDCPTLQQNNVAVARIRVSDETFLGEDCDRGAVYSTVQIHPILRKSGDNPASWLRYYVITMKEITGNSIIDND